MVVSTTAANHARKNGKPIEFGRWLCRRKPCICCPNLGCALQRAVSRCLSRIHSEACTLHRQQLQCDDATLPHYTNAAAAVWGGASLAIFPCFCYASHLHVMF